MSALLNGFGKDSFTMNAVPKDTESRNIYLDVVQKQNGHFLPVNENNIFSTIIGLIYFVFGYFPLGVRVFNISLSIFSVYFLFRIAKRKFGVITANLFLIIALF